MKTAGDNNPFTLPSALLAQVEAAADEEHRLPRELVREALERYMEDREWNKLFAYGEDRARVLSLTAGDIPRLIADSREENRRGRE